MRRCLLLLPLALVVAVLLWGPTLLPAAEPEPNPESEGLPEDPGNGKALQLVLDTGGHTAPITQVLFTPDGKEIITVALDKTIRIWDATTGQTNRVLRPPSTTGSPGSLLAGALSPNGQVLAVCASSGVKNRPNLIYLVRLSDGAITRTVEAQAGRSAALACASDGTRLAFVSPGEKPYVRIWDSATGKVVRDLDCPEGEVRSLAFSPDGRFLAVGATGYNAPVQVWDLKTTILVANIKLLGPIAALAWSPDSHHLAVCGRDGATLLEGDGETFNHVWRKGGPSTRFALFTPDGGMLLNVGTLGGQLVRLDLATGKGRTEFVHGIRVLSGAALSPDGKSVAAIDSRKPEVLVWKTEDGTLLHRLAGKGDNPTEAVWAEDGKRVGWTAQPPVKKESPVYARSFRLDDLELGPALEKDFSGPLHREGRVALTRVPKTGTIEVSHGSTVRYMQPFRDISFFTLLPNNRAALAGEDGGLWLSSSKTGKILHPLLGHSAVVTSLAVVSSRPYLLSAGADQTLRLWNTDREPTGDAPLYPLLSLLVAGNDWVIWTPEGYYAASPGGEKLVGWVTDNGPERMMTFYPVQRFRKRLYRPDVIKLVLEKGNLKDALAAANAVRKQEGEQVAEGVADVEQLLPPRTALEVVDKSGLPKVKVKATAEAAAKSQPISALRLLVDGRPLPAGSGVLDLQAGQPKAEAEWEVELPPGDHELKVLARSPDVVGVSAAVPVSVPVPARERPTLHLLAVGVDAYQQAGLKLDCAVNDARGVTQAFQEHCAGQDNLFGNVRSTTLLDDRASRVAVLDALKEERKTVKPGDLLVFSFAGHGVKQGKEFYLLTVEADTTNLAQTALSGKELRQALADMPCQVLLLLDACHSAAGVRAFLPATDEAARDLSDDDCAIAVLCAAMGQEKALEGGQHGFFTQALVEALAKQQDVPYNYRDGRQYVHHLFAYVFDEVKELSKDQQHPFLNLPFVTESFPIRRLAAKVSEDR